jgi:endonuclease/exonuclease/phosphatase family metal-dependent hydrolase
MRIASFNVENLTDSPKSDVPLSARIDVLRPQLERLSADILCLQEVDAAKVPEKHRREHRALETLLENTPYQHFHLASSLDRKHGYPRKKHNLVTLSRWPIKRSAQYQCDLVRPPAYQCATSDPPEADLESVTWDRPILHLEVELPGGRALHVLNMHLRAPLAARITGQKRGPFVWKSVSGWAEGYFLASIKRSGQALEARMLVDRLFDLDPKALIAVSGDFNSEEREVPLRIVTGHTEDTGNGRLSGRALVLLEHSLPEQRRFTVVHRGQKMMLDHLLVSRQLLSHYRGIEVHNEALGDELIAYTLIDAAPDSYHAPIVATFDMA